MSTDAEFAVRNILEQIDRPLPVRNASELAADIQTFVASLGEIKDEVASQLEVDWLACALTTRALIVYPQVATGQRDAVDRICGAFTWSDGTESPDKHQLSSESLDYLVKRHGVGCLH